MADLACIIHVHSTFSDGTATVPEIVQAASAAGADAVLLTDHDTLEAARQGLEGWHGDVLLLVGHEITTRRGHFLAFGLDREVEHEGLSETEICAEVKAHGGFGFAAHPFSRGGIVPSIVRPHPWQALDDCPDCGIELWSLATDAAERWRSPLAALRFLRHPEAALDGPPTGHLAEWDRLSQRRRVPAIGGLDAHQTGFRIAGRVFSPMPHERYFRLLRTHVQLLSPPTRELKHDRAAIYRALEAGRCYLAVDVLAPARGFDFRARDPDGQIVPMGGKAKSGRCVLSASVPHSASLRLLCDGRLVSENHGLSIEHQARDAGAYRVEAALEQHGRLRPWIYSNPIYVS